MRGGISDIPVTSEADPLLIQHLRRQSNRNFLPRQEQSSYSATVSLHHPGHARGKKGRACNANKETDYRVAEV
jgi:hypothetical protein